MPDIFIFASLFTILKEIRSLILKRKKKREMKKKKKKKNIYKFLNALIYLNGTLSTRSTEYRQVK